MDCPKCQNPINIRKQVECDKCGYNLLSKLDVEQNHESTVAERPKPEERTVWEWYVKCWKEFSNFQGRARRMEYWSFVLINVLFLTPLFTLGIILDGVNVFIIIGAIYWVAIIIPSLAVAVRRLHDSGKSGWWLFFSIITGIISEIVPFLAFSVVSLILGLIILVFMFWDSSDGRNNWGDSPKYPEGWQKTERKSERFG